MPRPTSTSDRPLVLVDFDGVINVPATLELRERGHWARRRVYIDGWQFPETIFYQPDCGRWLRGLAAETGAELAWASMRGGENLNMTVSPLLGLPPIGCAPAYWVTKAEVVVPWTEGRPFVWFEDLDREVECADELAEGQPHLMVKVDPEEGLTFAQVRQALHWLRSLPH